MTKRNKHIGSTFDNFAADERMLNQFRAKAIKEVAAWRRVSAANERKPN